VPTRHQRPYWVQLEHWVWVVIPDRQGSCSEHLLLNSHPQSLESIPGWLSISLHPLLPPSWHRLGLAKPCISPFSPHLILIFKILGGVGIWAHGFMFAKQSFYHLSHALFTFICFYSLQFSPSLGLDHDLPTSASWVAEITGFCHMPSLFLELGSH
jgi:hypothetical protein